MTKLKTVDLHLPATREDLAKLEIGTVVYLSGRVHTAREGVYKRAVEEHANVPDAIGTASFHCSPAASVGPNGELTVGAVTGTGNALSVGGAGDTTLSGGLNTSTAGSLSKSGSGTLAR